MQKEVNKPLQLMRTWLQPFQYSVELITDETSLPDKTLGMYESGSVFTKEILIYVSPSRIRKELRKLNGNTKDFSYQCALTVYHEVGHALIEQLVDYSESIPEYLPALENASGKRFFDIFNDDNLTEEEIVKAFAYGFLTGRGSLLQRCWEESDKIIETL